MTRFSFRLYVTGETTRSRQAIANLRSVCEERIAGHYELAIVDVLERPDLADEDKVIATPTVIRLLPTPHRRVIGDLSDLNLAATGGEARQHVRLAHRSREVAP